MHGKTMKRFIMPFHWLKHSKEIPNSSSKNSYFILAEMKGKKEKFLSIWSLLPIQVSFQPNIIWFSKAKYSKVLGHMRVKWQNVAFIDAKTWHQMSSRNIKVQCKFNESTNQLGKHAFVLIQLDFLFWMIEYGVGRYAIWADRFG